MDAVWLPNAEAAPDKRKSSHPILILAAISAIVIAFGLWFMLIATPGRKSITSLSSIEQAALSFIPQSSRLFATVEYPVGIAVEPGGNRIFVAEAGGERMIKVFDKEGKLVASVAPPGTAPPDRWPTRLTVDEYGRIYVVDRLRAVVDVYGPDFKWQRAWRPTVLAARDGWMPSGIWAGPRSRLYVTQTAGDDPGILVFNTDGRLVDRLSRGMGLGATLNNPTQAVADGENRVYVGDGTPGRLLVAGPHGVQVIDQVGGVAFDPRGLALGRGMLFIADAISHQVLVFSLGDRPMHLSAFGRTDVDKGAAYVAGVAVDNAGHVYVADWFGHRVHVYSY